MPKVQTLILKNTDLLNWLLIRMSPSIVINNNIFDDNKFYIKLDFIVLKYYLYSYKITIKNLKLPQILLLSIF